MSWSWGIIIFFVVHLLMMMFMMKGHNHGGNHSHGNSNGNKENHEKHIHIPSNENNRLENYKIKQLEGELANLKSQNKLLKEKIDDLS